MADAVVATAALGESVSAEPATGDLEFTVAESAAAELAVEGPARVGVDEAVAIAAAEAVIPSAPEAAGTGLVKPVEHIVKVIFVQPLEVDLRSATPATAASRKQKAQKAIQAEVPAVADTAVA